MSPDEARRALEGLAAAWPNTEIDEQTARLWLSVLGGIHVDDGRAACVQLVRTSRFFPAISEFVDATENAARRRQTVEHRALPSGTTNAASERVRRAIEHGLDQLAMRGTRGHNHGGPDPCPVCGGQADTRPRTREANVIDLRERLAERRRRLEQAAEQ